MDLQEVSFTICHHLTKFSIHYILKSLAGKTLLARAVAHHTECTFIRVSGSELVQKFIGEGSRMVRELFVMAREHAPSIVSLKK
jgi:ATP-dependent Zn protease